MSKQVYHICDRCGNRVGMDTYDLTIRGKVLKDAKTVLFESRSGYNMRADLCDNCLKELIDWWRAVVDDSQ